MELCVCVGEGGGMCVGACKRKRTSQSELKICTRALIRGVAQQVLDQRLALRRRIDKDTPTGGETQGRERMRQHLWYMWVEGSGFGV